MTVTHFPARFALGAVLFLLSSPASAQALSVADLDWMQGCWRTAGENATHEHWSSAEGGLLVGWSRSLRDGRAVAFEHLRIQVGSDGRPTLVALPSGQAATAFPAVARFNREIVFENLDHDFPNRITYSRTGDQLRARVEGVVDGQTTRGFTVEYRRTRCDTGGGSHLASVAVRVADLEAMTAFYREAFGVAFEDAEVDGLVYRTGQIGTVEVKLVPIRDAPDFDGVGIVQVGFAVPDVEAAVARAVARGGQRMDGDVRNAEGTIVHAAIRDPDGNTIELYAASNGVW